MQGSLVLGSEPFRQIADGRFRLSTRDLQFVTRVEDVVNSGGVSQLPAAIVNRNGATPAIDGVRHQQRSRRDVGQQMRHVANRQMRGIM